MAQRTNPRQPRSSNRPLLKALLLMAALSIAMSAEAAKQDQATQTAEKEVKFETDDHVLVLNKKNIDQAIKQFDHIFIDFYAPWCQHCQELEPKFKEMAKQFAEKGSNIKFAKFNADKYHKVANDFNVSNSLLWLIFQTVSS